MVPRASSADWLAFLCCYVSSSGAMECEQGEWEQELPQVVPEQKPLCNEFLVISGSRTACADALESQRSHVWCCSHHCIECVYWCWFVPHFLLQGNYLVHAEHSQADCYHALLWMSGYQNLNIKDDTKNTASLLPTHVQDTPSLSVSFLFLHTLFGSTVSFWQLTIRLALAID